jgi:hypothetical protein
MYGAGGSVIGAGIGGAIGRTANASRDKFAEHAIQGADDGAGFLRRFQELGGRLTPGQASNSPAQRWVETGVFRSPFSVGTFKKLYEGNLKVLTRTAAKAMGQSCDDLGPSNLNRVAQSRGATFDDVGRQIKSVPVDPAMSGALKDSLPTLTARKFTAQVATGRLTGREYLSLRSKLGEVARGNFTTRRQSLSPH